eukprot:CAMPEP_0183421504 /NCGR_PEP_ID=MMETSP0370-20130417/27145_1 /TAXON_ID=268820 /ORGANISM="Peridinium aciculiferum, Strain PAER-2" /LENGTH=123 /DNA_ID=CAMNT_0025605497 /DNA_START=216 /DNA_END=586 /DNA_ORIENTATION=-
MPTGKKIVPMTTKAAFFIPVKTPWMCRMISHKAAASDEQLDDPNICDPPPLIGVDGAYNRPPSRVVDPLCKVGDGEAVQAHEAEQARHPERPEAILHDVAEHPRPMVDVEVRTTRQEDDVAGD